MDLVHRGIVSVPFHFDSEAEAVARLLVHYANVPMSFADACLVRMAEQHARSKLLTLDRDFLVYRKNGRQVIPTIMPAST
jgi:predicted nucleic acid-binding protein